MITNLRVQGFKSWKDTGEIRLAPITGLFGTNSSGKTAILQALLMMKQTVESVDRSRVLHTGDDRSYVDLGTFYDIAYGHELPSTITLSLTWQTTDALKVYDPEGEQGQTVLFATNSVDFRTSIRGTEDTLLVTEFSYDFATNGTKYRYGMKRTSPVTARRKSEYDLIAEGYAVRRTRGRPWPLPAPVKSYGFPDQVNAYFQNAGFLSDLVLSFEKLFQGVYYLGPLREYPHRSYLWAGEQPGDVGRKGELAVPALLAADARGTEISTRGKGRGGRRKVTVTERVAQWLRDLGLIHEFTLQPIKEYRKEYEVRVRYAPETSDVLITDVGFGVSQILPVLVLCYYAPEGSTLILEQPEIHLHPSVQAGLADVFVDVATTRSVQIILESHSEHLLRRLQRRIAEERLKPDQTALYFVTVEGAESKLETLSLDLFGNIGNWPANFFGDEMGELAAMTMAAMQRQAGNGAG